MYFHSVNTGFVDVPNKTSLNIYTVGCPHFCKGCQAQDLQDINHKDRKLLTFQMIQKMLNDGEGFFNSICWLGGDPLYQFDQFIKLNKELKQSKFNNLLNVVYTGYEIKDFGQDKINQLLQCVDIIVDGPWRGITIQKQDSNQKIWIKRNNKFQNITFKQFSQIK